MARLNVLFIAIDDVNTDLGCYGAPVKTPHIDRLASRGVRFDRAYCQYPLCNPSRSSMLSGWRPPKTGIMENRTWFRDRTPIAVTIPQHFRANGYTSMCTGKIFHGGLDDDRAWDIGGTPLNRQAPRSPEEQKQREKTADRWEALPGDGEQTLDYRTASRAVELLKQKRDKPFFLAVGFAKPHVPFLAPKKYFDLYANSPINLPPDFAPEPTGAGPAYRANFDIFIKRKASETEARQMILGYRAATSFMDAQVGRVLTALEETGEAANTAVVLFGDHGFHLGEKGMWSKQTLFEVSARVPLIIAAPGKSSNKTASGTVELVDVYPTLNALCGLSAPANLDGESLAPLLDNPSQSWNHPAFTYLQRGNILGITVRTARYRYTEWDNGDSGVELYDHQSDPRESRNLAKDPSMSFILTTHRKLIHP